MGGGPTYRRARAPTDHFMDRVRTPAHASFYPASWPPSHIYFLASVCDLGAILPSRARRAFANVGPLLGPFLGRGRSWAVTARSRCRPPVRTPPAPRTPQGWPHALALPASGVPAHPPHPPRVAARAGEASVRRPRASPASPKGGRTRWRSQRQASRASTAPPRVAARAGAASVRRPRASPAPPKGGRTRWRSQRQASPRIPALPQGWPHALAKPASGVPAHHCASHALTHKGWPHAGEPSTWRLLNSRALRICPTSCTE
jgi:hypothetical protein